MTSHDIMVIGASAGGAEPESSMSEAVLPVRTCVISEHGQGFLVLVPGVIGRRNPCPYESVSFPK
jgi:hypothetical protein